MNIVNIVQGFSLIICVLSISLLGFLFALGKLGGPLKFLVSLITPIASVILIINVEKIASFLAPYLRDVSTDSLYLTIIVILFVNLFIFQPNRTS